MKTFDVIVVGAGTSGMMAAITAAQTGARTLLIEKNKRLGKKLLLTGGGRCNVTNNRPAAEIIAHIPGNGKFLYSAFSQFDNYDIMNFFETNGVHLKEEDHGRMFPVTDKSKTIVAALDHQLQALRVIVQTNSTVTKLLHKDQQILGVQTETETFFAPSVVLTTGGRTYPATGSTGDGYQLAKKVGHTISPLYPTESPLISEEPFIQQKTLQGLALQDIALSVVNQKGKVLVTHQMDVLFTHFGLSGPAALRCSSYINQELAATCQPVTVILDVFPDLAASTLQQQIERQLAANANKTIKNALHGLIPERLLQFYLEKLQLVTLPTKQITTKQISELLQLLKAFPITVAKTFPLEKSFVTGGGISLKEVTPKTMESKLINGLFFAGELLDINGYTGGYNVTAAFVTGHVAGQHAAQTAAYFAN
ncbi:NAD(P)/FAD-dependent oxidoreductase [Enterococcus faecalis]